MKFMRVRWFVAVLQSLYSLAANFIILLWEKRSRMFYCVIVTLNFLFHSSVPDERGSDPTNRPILSCLLPLFQNESCCTAFHMEMSFTCTFTFLQIKLISITKVVNQDSFWNRGKRQLGNGLLMENYEYDGGNYGIFGVTNFLFLWSFLEKSLEKSCFPDSSWKDPRWSRQGRTIIWLTHPASNFFLWYKDTSIIPQGIPWGIIISGQGDAMLWQ